MLNCSVILNYSPSIVNNIFWLNIIAFCYWPRITRPWLWPWPSSQLTAWPIDLWPDKLTAGYRVKTANNRCQRSLQFCLRFAELITSSPFWPFLSGFILSYDFTAVHVLAQYWNISNSMHFIAIFLAKTLIIITVSVVVSL